MMKLTCKLRRQTAASDRGNIGSDFRRSRKRILSPPEENENKASIGHTQIQENVHTDNDND